MMDEYERMLRDGLRQAVDRRPPLGTIDPAELMAPRSTDDEPIGLATPETPKAPLARRHPGVRWAIGVAAAAAAAALLLLVPGLLTPKPIPATPVATSPPAPEPVEPTPTIEPTTEPEPEPEPGVDLADLTVSTAGWKTFSSPEYPITFMYPPDWELSYSKRTAALAKAEQLTPAGIVDGCGVDGCDVHLRPPGQGDEGTHVVLMRTGFYGDGFSGPIPGAWLLATLPNLQVWTSADPTVEPVAATVMMRSAAGFRVGGPPKDLGAPYDYMLSTAELAPAIAVGEANPLAEHPEASFSFEANGGVPEDQVNTVVTILTSVRENPDFNPTQPARDKSGRPKFGMRSMDAAPTSGIDSVDSSGWETLEVPDGNISLRVPPKWKVSTLADDDDGTRSGITHIVAPSGYVIAVLTNGEAEFGCQSVTEWRIPERLGYLPGLTAADADGVERTVDLWWQDATWTPAQVWLSVTRPTEGSLLCSQSVIDYGGLYPVYVGSADNSKNPTQAELVQAAAILTSLERLS